MSIPVKIEDLAGAVADRSFGYLLTVGDDDRPHVVATIPALDQTGLLIPHPGRRTQANAASRPDVTLVYPPADPGGYSLIVDGRSEPAGHGLRVVPASAVLHRPATPTSPPSATGCGSDCRPATGPRASR